MLVSPKLMPDLARAVAASALVIYASDLLEILLVLPGAIRGQLRFAGNGGMTVKGRRGDRQNTADRLDPIDLAMLLDEGDHLRNGRSSSAWAKYADAFFRISLAVRSSLTSRSSSLIRAFSSLLGPLRSPASRAA